MSKDTFQSTVIAVLPGNQTVTFVVHDQIEEQAAEMHCPSTVPFAMPMLVLAQVLNACLPDGLARFHAWKCFREIQGNIEGITVQMANVPAIDEDELPF